MRRARICCRQGALALAVCGLWAGPVFSISAAEEPAGEEIRIWRLEGTAEISTTKGTDWISTQPNQPLRPGYRLRIGPNSRATLRWSDHSVVSFKQLTEIEILPPDGPRAQAGLHLFKGILSFFHRDKPSQIRVISLGAPAGVEGTEFVMAIETVNNVEQTRLSVIDGRVTFGRGATALTLTNMEEAVAVVGRAPARTPGFAANNVLQWCFYYPAVLDLRDLPLTAEEQQAVADSLAAYRQGDLTAALAKYPGGRLPASDAERVYHAALLLAVGEVDQTEDALKALGPADPSERIPRLANALRQLIAAVKRQERPAVSPPELSTEFLAASYYEQSRAVRETALRGALALARQAADTSPEFGFAWARVAELEFSFGRTSRALAALSQALALTPRNAQALALQGFLLAAQNKTREAIDSFNQAIGVDGGLGNAWLGRGLCRIRRGDRRGGSEDLLVAAALEPQRAFLRSYLGKAYGDAGDSERAAAELALAKKLDPADPTAWLYSALLLQQENRVNEATDELEKSQALNDNRRLYRSKLLLDQDRAVRSVNLARIYDDADMSDVAVREAGLAVLADYGNYSAHSFLANSFEVERRANLSDTRLETASFNEYLLANLLGPANGRLLAQPVNQLEYSTLLEQDRLGFASSTEYFSRGAWHNSSAQYGTLNGSSYSLESEYRWEPGERVNQDLEILQLEGKFKHDFTPDDSMYLHVIGFWADGGDIAQRFDEQEIHRTYRFHEEQTPTVLAGYHHQWAPGNHTLLLAGRFDDTFASKDQDSSVYVLDRFFGTITGLVPVPVREKYHSEYAVYTAEAQQIAVAGAHSLIGGARVEWSKQDVADLVPEADGFDPNSFLLGTNKPVSDQHGDLKSYLTAVYAYDYFQLSDTLQLAGGLNYTHQTIPANTTTAPVSAERDRQARLSPRGGVVWAPASNSTVRASYAKSLTGSGLGQSVRLEPSQTAGMLQVIRNPVPPSLVGPLDGADVQTAEALWDGHFPRTYLSLGGQWLNAERTRRLGLFLSDPLYDPGPSFGLIRERVKFNEYAMTASAHRLVGEEWSFGVQYRLAYARLERSFPDYIGLGPTPANGGVDDQSDWKGWLHTLKLTGLYRLPSGLFARAEGVFFAQTREQDGLSVPDDDFWQLNLTAGYRFPRQKAEISMGVLNVLGGDYRLDPINQHVDPPRSRTFYARLLLNF